METGLLYSWGLLYESLCSNCSMSCIILSDITSLKDVYEYVFDLDVSQFKQLGLQLGLLLPTLKRIADCTKPEDYGMEVMNEWLKQADNAKPTWNNLAIALDKRTVKGHVQANELRKNLKSMLTTVHISILYVCNTCFLVLCSSFSSGFSTQLTYLTTPTI